MTKHSHYHKDVRHLESIDIYAVCEMFGVDDPSGATQHAIKKLLMAGKRGGGKDLQRDLQEAVDTIERRLSMLRADKRRHAMTPNVIEVMRDGDCLACGQKGGHGGLLCQNMTPYCNTSEETRMDIIGRNGNDGLHYSALPAQD